MDVRKMYINNQWVLSETGDIREIINPATEEVIAQVTEGNFRDVSKAIQAAHKAFYENNWGETYGRYRAEILLKVANKLENDIESFAMLETLNNGKPLRESRYDIEDAVNQFRYYAGLITKPSGQVYDVPDDIQSYVVKEPVGVTGLIVPWNYPMVMAVQKLAPALAAGCTVVIKPAEQTPLTLIKLFEIFDEVGFPPGVVNLVLGSGEAVGEELSTNPLIDKIAFTGGTITGKKIMKNATETLKNISLELGGKSPNIVFEDTDYETAVDYALYAIFANQGQVCSAGSRLILQESIYEQFVKDLVDRAKLIKVGDGTDVDTEMGPLITEHHLKRVLNYIQKGVEEGAKLLCGGERLFEKGYFVAPTIFTDTHENMTIVKEEIFGPVLVIQTFKDEEEAIKLANNTIYGLAGAVFTSDGARALRVIRKLRVGITWINTYHPTFNEAPWGGYKQSGIGRELGTFGLEAFQEVKQVNINLNVRPSGWFKYNNKS